MQCVTCKTIFGVNEPFGDIRLFRYFLKDDDFNCILCPNCFIEKQKNTLLNLNEIFTVHFWLARTTQIHYV